MGSHPLLVADLPDDAAVQALLRVAHAGGDAWVPLLAAPSSAVPHVLELVHPGGARPVRVLATPLGERGPRGVRLRLGLLSRSDTPDTSDAPPPSDRGLEGRALAGGAFVLGSLVERGDAHALHRAHERGGRGHLVARVVAPELAADASFRARFLAEAAAGARLTHPNLVRVRASGVEDEELLWVVSEQPEGQTLRERLTAEGPLLPAKLVPLALQICDALGAAHAVGLVHRDVRPDNVVLSVEIDRAALPRVVAKVREIGFGLGRRLASGRVASGAPEYMSPEQCRGTEDLDPRSDVYAFGILLYELVTGQVPFTSDKTIVVVNRQLSMAPQPPSVLRSGLDPRMDALVLRALKKAPSDRFGTMGELGDALRRLLDSPPPPPPRAPAPLPVVSIPPAAASSPAALPSIPPAAPSSRRVVPPAAPSSRPGPGTGPATSAPPPVGARPSARPAWLVDAGAGHSAFLQNLASGGSVVPIEDVTEAVRRDPRAYAARLVAREDPRAFLAEMKSLQAAMPNLVAAADARALWTVSSALQGVATEGRPDAGSRAAIAARALAWFHDPKLLGPVAERRLADGDAAAHTLLVRAGARGAHALYGARVKLAAHAPARAPFVETMRAIGAAAWPVAKAALERMPAAALEGRNAAGAELSVDLLTCLPTLPDGEAEAAVLRRYVRAEVPELAALAARVFARSAPIAAGHVFLELLSDAREGVRLSAIAGLREMGAVDAEVVAKLAPLVRREVPATPALRLAAIAALRAVVVDARGVAVPLLVAVVRKTSARGEERIVLAAAEALLAMLGNQARAVVLECLDRSEEPLRTALTELLANPVLELGSG